MATVIGVRFKEVGKIYYFDPTDIDFKQNDKVIVETSRGVECGTVALTNKEVEEDKIVHPLKKVLRQATKKDLEHLAENKKREVDLFFLIIVAISFQSCNPKHCFLQNRGVNFVENEFSLSCISD